MCGASAAGKPEVFAVTRGERHEQAVATNVVGTGGGHATGAGTTTDPARAGRGRQGVQQSNHAADLKGRRIGAVIPSKTNQVADPRFHREAYRERNVVERLINRLKQLRRVATCYKKRAVNYLAMLSIAAILLWL